MPRTALSNVHVSSEGSRSVHSFSSDLLPKLTEPFRRHNHSTPPSSGYAVDLSRPDHGLFVIRQDSTAEEGLSAKHANDPRPGNLARLQKTISECDPSAVCVERNSSSSKLLKKIKKVFVRSSTVETPSASHDSSVPAPSKRWWKKLAKQLSTHALAPATSGRLGAASSLPTPFSSIPAKSGFGSAIEDSQLRPKQVPSFLEQQVAAARCSNATPRINATTAAFNPARKSSGGSDAWDMVGDRAPRLSMAADGPDAQVHLPYSLAPVDNPSYESSPSMSPIITPRGSMPLAEPSNMGTRQSATSNGGCGSPLANRVQNMAKHISTLTAEELRDPELSDKLRMLFIDPNGVSLVGSSRQHGSQPLPFSRSKTETLEPSRYKRTSRPSSLLASPSLSGTEQGSQSSGKPGTHGGGGLLKPLLSRGPSMLALQHLQQQQQQQEDLLAAEGSGMLSKLALALEFSSMQPKPGSTPSFNASGFAALQQASTSEDSRTSAPERRQARAKPTKGMQQGGRFEPRACRLGDQQMRSYQGISTFPAAATRRPAARCASLPSSGMLRKYALSGAMRKHGVDTSPSPRQPPAAAEAPAPGAAAAAASVPASPPLQHGEVPGSSAQVSAAALVSQLQQFHRRRLTSPGFAAKPPIPAPLLREFARGQQQQRERAADLAAAAAVPAQPPLQLLGQLASAQQASSAALVAYSSQGYTQQAVDARMVSTIEAGSSQLLLPGQLFLCDAEGRPVPVKLMLPSKSPWGGALGWLLLASGIMLVLSMMLAVCLLSLGFMAGQQLRM